MHRNQASSQQRQPPQLSVTEIFLVGLFSKFVATMVTYPLIRAKVLLMVNVVEEEEEEGTDDEDNNDDDGGVDGGGGSDINTNGNSKHDSTTARNKKNRKDSSSSSLSSSSVSLWSVLQEAYQKDQEGIKGLYKGCNWQLLHTLLKSAFMMTIREQITETARSLFTTTTTTTTTTQ